MTPHGPPVRRLSQVLHSRRATIGSILPMPALRSSLMHAAPASAHRSPGVASERNRSGGIRCAGVTNPAAWSLDPTIRANRSPRDSGARGPSRCLGLGPCALRLGLALALPTSPFPWVTLCLLPSSSTPSARPLPNPPCPCCAPAPLLHGIAIAIAPPRQQSPWPASPSFVRRCQHGSKKPMG